MTTLATPRTRPVFAFSNGLITRLWLWCCGHSAPAQRQLMDASVGGTSELTIIVVVQHRACTGGAWHRHREVFSGIFLVPENGRVLQGVFSNAPRLKPLVLSTYASRLSLPIGGKVLKALKDR